MSRHFRPSLAAAVAALAWSSAAVAGPVTLKIATLAPEGSAWMRALEGIKAEIAAATAGEVRLRLYPAGVMGEERDVLVKIKAGQLDGAGFLGNGIARICPEANALMLPMTFRDYAEVDAALKELTPYLEERSRANGYEALGWTEVGFTHLFGNREVRSVEDLRRAKLWSLPNDPMLAELFQQAGISAIPVPVADVLTALQTGLLDTVYSPPLAALAMQWAGRVKYLNALRLAYSFGGLFIARSSWERLPTAHRDRLREIARTRVADLTAEVRRGNEEALDVMARNGMIRVESGPADLAAFEEISGRTRRALRGRVVPPEADDKVLEFLKRHRAGSP